MLPLHVAAGAAGDDEGHVLHEDEIMGVGIVSFMFGQWPGNAVVTESTV